MESSEKLAKLDELFGSYKAEWLRGKIFDFFVAPAYFGTFKDNRPCILQGGRGTGKTSVLRGLSYQGQYAILNKDLEKFDQNEFIGLYYRVNTNHVHAFQGRGIDDADWSLLFAHYFNLESTIFVIKPNITRPNHFKCHAIINIHISYIFNQANNVFFFH